MHYRAARSAAAVEADWPTKVQLPALPEQRGEEIDFHSFISFFFSWLSAYILPAFYFVRRPFGIRAVPCCSGQCFGLLLLRVVLLYYNYYYYELPGWLAVDMDRLWQRTSSCSCSSSSPSHSHSQPESARSHSERTRRVFHCCCLLGGTSFLSSPLLFFHFHFHFFLARCSRAAIIITPSVRGAKRSARCRVRERE